MNKTKKYLIIVAIIFNFLDIAGQIYDIVQYFLTEPQNRIPVFYVVLNFITILECIAVATLLIMAIWKKGTLFRQRYGLYMTALVISIIINLFSVSSILLIITMFISDWTWQKTTINQNETIIDITNESREEKISELRKKRESGEISEEEFQERLLDLL